MNRPSYSRGCCGSSSARAHSTFRPARQSRCAGVNECITACLARTEPSMSPSVCLPSHASRCIGMRVDWAGESAHGPIYGRRQGRVGPRPPRPTARRGIIHFRASENCNSEVVTVVTAGCPGAIGYTNAFVTPGKNSPVFKASSSCTNVRRGAAYGYDLRVLVAAPTSIGVTHALARPPRATQRGQRFSAALHTLHFGGLLPISRASSRHFQ